MEAENEDSRVAAEGEAEAEAREAEQAENAVHAAREQLGSNRTHLCEHGAYPRVKGPCIPAPYAAGAHCRHRLHHGAGILGRLSQLHDHVEGGETCRGEV